MLDVFTRFTRDMLARSCSAALVLLLACTSTAQPMPEIPQIPAFLPNVDAVPKGPRTSIDGVWRIDSIGKRIRIESGRAYALDPWLHLFVLKVEPRMVVVKNIRKQGNRFIGEDLALLGQWVATKASGGRLNVNVAGMFGPVRFQLIPVDRELPSSPPEYDDDEYEDDYQNDEYVEDDYEDDEYSEDEYGEDEYEYEEEEGYDEVVQEADSPKRSTRRDSTPTCGGRGEMPCRNVAATRVGAAKNLGCPGRQSYFSTLKGGSCWSCPSNYKRTHRPMNHAKACKKRKSLSGPWKPAKYQKRAWGCPANQFHMGPPTGGQCMSCPTGYKRIAAAGMDTGQCRASKSCDAGLRKAKAPPKDNFIDSIIGSKKAEVCAPKFDIKEAFKRDMPRFKSLRKPGLDLVEELLSDKKYYKRLKRAIKQKNYVRAFKLVRALDAYSPYAISARKNGFDSFSIGYGSDVQIGFGGTGEIGFAVDLRRERVVGYESVGFTKGAAIGIDSGVTLGMWKGGFDSGYAQGFTGSVGGVVSAGMGLWYTYFDAVKGQERLSGLTFTGGVGLGVEFGEYNEVGTRVFN